MTLHENSLLKNFPKLEILEGFSLFLKIEFILFLKVITTLLISGLQKEFILSKSFF